MARVCIGRVRAAAGLRPTVPWPGNEAPDSTNGGREPLWARDGRTLGLPGAEPHCPRGPHGHGGAGHGRDEVYVGKAKAVVPDPVRRYDPGPRLRHREGRAFSDALQQQPVPSGVVTHLDIIQNWSMDLLQKVPSRARR